MRLLIDTHVLIRMRREPHRLSKRVKILLNDNDQSTFVSAISAWEIGIKVHAGKLDFSRTFLDTFDDSVRASGFEPLPITAKHAAIGAHLPGLHKDPFDRMLAGQAVSESLVLVTADPAFSSLGIKTLWE